MMEKGFSRSPSTSAVASKCTLALATTLPPNRTVMNCAARRASASARREGCAVRSCLLVSRAPVACRNHGKSHFASKGTTYQRMYLPIPRSNTSHHSASAARIQGL